MALAAGGDHCLVLGVHGIVEEPPVIVEQALDRTVLAGMDATFSVVVEGDEPLSYQWRKDGVNLSGDTKPTLTIVGAQAADAGLYDVLVSNAAGAVASFPRRLWLSPGTVIAWGQGEDGEATVPEGIVDAIGVAAGGPHTLVLRADGSLLAWGRNTYGQGSVPEDLGAVTAVSAGSEFNVALHPDGTVSAWGRNYFGQTNVPDGLEDVVAICAGSAHAVALRADGTIVAWGYPYFGVTQVPEGLDEVTAVSAGSYHTLAVRADGSVVAWGDNTGGRCEVPTGLTDVVAVAAGQHHSVAVRRNGEVVAWGSDADGATDVPLDAGRIVGLSAGAAHTVGIREDGTLVGWGSTRYMDSLTGPNLSEVAALDYGGRHQVALGVSRPAPMITQHPRGAVVMSEDDLNLSVEATGQAPLTYQWRRNGVDLPGETTSSLALSGPLPSDTAAYDVVVNNNVGSTVSLPARVAVSPGTAVAWGDNEYQQLDLPEGILDAVGVDAGEGHSLLLHATGAVVAWGRNKEGQADVPGDLNDAVAVAAGSRHSLALRLDGSVMAWGANGDGQASVPSGLGGVVEIAAGGRHSLALLEDGRVVGWGADDAGQGTPPVNLGPVARIAAGRNHSLALQVDGRVVAWGSHDFGQANVPVEVGDVVAIAAGDDHNLILRRDGTVFAWGRDQFGDTDVPAGLNQVVAIAAGAQHSLALQADGTLVAWGRNNRGQLQIPNGLVRIAQLAAGGAHNLILAGHPPEIRRHPWSRVVVAGTAVSLSVEAGGTGPFSYQWRKGGEVLEGAVAMDLTLDPTTAGDEGAYDVLVSNSLGAVTSDAAMLSVLLPPSVVVHPEGQAVIAGSTVTFQVVAAGDPPLSFSWRKGEEPIPGANAASLELTGVQPAHAGLYSVVISNPYGVLSSRAAELIVHTPPAITLEPSSQAVPEGTAASFAVEATGSEPLTFEWTKDGGSVPGGNGPRLSIPAADSRDTGTYRVTVSNPWGTATSEAVTLSVGVAPTILSQPVFHADVPNGGVVIGLSATGDHPLHYAWHEDQELIAQTAGSALYLPDREPATLGAVYVVVSNEHGSDVSDLARELPNLPPQASPDTVTRSPGAAIKIATADLLANDTDPDLDVLRIISVSETSAQGASVAWAEGWILYQPPNDPGGPDQFTYQVYDGRGGADETTVTVTVEDAEGGLTLNKLTEPELNPDGSVTLRFVGIPSRTYAIERTTSLASPAWLSLGTAQADGQGLLAFVDTSPPPEGAFYRTAAAQP